MVLCVFLGGLDEVADVGDVHVRLASHACRHVFDRGRRRTCDTTAFIDQREGEARVGENAPPAPTYATHHLPSPSISRTRSQMPSATL